MNMIDLKCTEDRANKLADKMQKIAEFLNVSVDYLMTGEEKEVPTFSTEHIELISAYDKLSSADKLAIMQIIKSLSEK